MDDLRIEPPVILVKRRFRLRIEASAAIGWGRIVREFAHERWREALEAAGGRPAGDPTFDVGRVDEGMQKFSVTVSGMALITPELADRLDEEAAARDES